MRFSLPRLPAWGLPTPGRRFSDTKAFDKAVGAVFSKVAVNGVVDDMALVVAMCELHFKIKSHVPGVTRTPTREAVREVLAGFDANRDGVLDEAEFRRFAKQVRAATGCVSGEGVDRGRSPALGQRGRRGAGARQGGWQSWSVGGEKGRLLRGAQRGWYRSVALPRLGGCPCGAGKSAR